MSNLSEDKSCSRESAVSALKSRAEQLIRRGQQLMALAATLEQIEWDATHPEDVKTHAFVAVGSDAEEALWELVCYYRG